MDIRDRLRYLGSALPPKPSHDVRSPYSEVECHVEGELCSNAYGSYFRSVSVFPAGYLQGDASIVKPIRSDGSVLEWLGRDTALYDIDLGHGIYLDTETTGLAGGAGTVPFLVGMGTWTDDGFRVEQMFMRDFHEEKAVLYEVCRRIEEAEAIVSYNGKAYDVNLLISRFTLARFDPDVFMKPHLDLLFTIRRLWRQRIGDCSLSSVEKHILHYVRECDIPGALIPSVYFDYLRTRDGTMMRSVFEHNRSDIVTLVALAALTSSIYADPLSMLHHPMDYYSLGRAMEGLQQYNRAALCYESALKQAVEKPVRGDLLHRLGYCFKRLGHWERAVDTWHEILRSEPGDLRAYEELAKYHEHRSRRIDTAIEMVSKALQKLDIMDALSATSTVSIDRSDLQYRMARLRRKIGKRKEKGWG